MANSISGEPHTLNCRAIKVYQNNEHTGDLNRGCKYKVFIAYIHTDTKVTCKDDYTLSYRTNGRDITIPPSSVTLHKIDPPANGCTYSYQLIAVIKRRKNLCDWFEGLFEGWGRSKAGHPVDPTDGTLTFTSGGSTPVTGTIDFTPPIDGDR